MRPFLTVLLLLALAFSGCIGNFDERFSLDAYGNEYEVLDVEGEVPEDGATVIGATARDLLTKADALAQLWSAEANLFTVTGFELAPSAADDVAVFSGPTPESYTQYDAKLGDGKAVAWNFLYSSAEHVSADHCQYLFVHVAHNGFAVSYVFDPSEMATESSDGIGPDLCSDHAPVHSHAEWSVDSDEAAAALASADARFSPAASDAEGALWVVSAHPESDPEDEAAFHTMWVVGMVPDVAVEHSYDDLLLCMTAASTKPLDTVCYDANGDDGSGTDDDDTPQPLAHDSGSGTIQFGLVFTTQREDTFSLSNGSHPALLVDVSISTEQVIPNAYTVALIGPDDAVADSFTKQANEGATETLTASAPAAGDWTVRITSEGGIPEATYNWCAQGFDYVNETAIECPVS